MGKRRIGDIANDLVLPVVEKHSFELVDVEYIKEGANWYLRVYIDKTGGITIDDCQIVSAELSDILDKDDPIKQSYIMEVSSPGLDRPLKKDSDFEKFKEEVVEVKVFQPIDGKKVFQGELIGLIDNEIVIKQENEQVMRFERDKVALVRKVVIF